MAKTARSPWSKANPRKRSGKPSKHLSAAQKKAAQARARRAGRRYPNLVDNMHEAAKARSPKKSKKSARKKSARKNSVRKSSGRKTTRRTRKTTTRKHARKR